MNQTAAFLLLIKKDEAGAVAELQIALNKPTFDTDGRTLVTRAIATADEFESARSRPSWTRRVCRGGGCSADRI